MIKVVNKYHGDTGVSIMRGVSPLANQFKLSSAGGDYTRAESLKEFTNWFHDKIQDNDLEVMNELRKLYTIALKGDLNLVCCCVPKACHGDVIKEWLDKYLTPRILVCGGRNHTYESIVHATLDQRLELHHKITIVSGMAIGPDTYACNWKKKHPEVELMEFPAKWDDIEGKPPMEIKTNKYGKQYHVRAGYLRNFLMLSNTDIVLAFWDGKSSGTKHMIDISKRAGKIVFVYKFTS